MDELAWAFKNPAAAKAKKDAAWAREVAKLQRAVRERLGDKPANEFYGQWQAKIQSQAGYGHMTVTDVPRVKAGWLYIGDYKIYNPSTKRFGKNVVDFTQQPASRNGFGYRGW